MGDPLPDPKTATLRCVVLAMRNAALAAGNCGARVVRMPPSVPQSSCGDAA
jgi:hypothetical protein